MKSYFAYFLLVLGLLFATPAFAGGPIFTELQRIAEAGDSISVDLDGRRYTANELMMVAQKLKHGATLTIKMQQQHLTVNECARIAQANPGRVRFVFD